MGITEGSEHTEWKARLIARRGSFKPGADVDVCVILKIYL